MIMALKWSDLFSILIDIFNNNGLSLSIRETKNSFVCWIRYFKKKFLFKSQSSRQRFISWMKDDWKTFLFIIKIVWKRCFVRSSIVVKESLDRFTPTSFINLSPIQLTLTINLVPTFVCLFVSARLLAFP